MVTKTSEFKFRLGGKVRYIFAGTFVVTKQTRSVYICSMKASLLVALLFIGCAPYVMKTRSGKPEITVSADQSTTSAALVNALIADGYVVDQQTPNLVSGTFVEHNIWVGGIKHTRQYSISKEGDSTRIILHHLVGTSPVTERAVMEADQSGLEALKTSLR